jgi:predicted RNase H-like nuclease (RuvC/YqgF family)
MIVTQ